MPPPLPLADVGRAGPADGAAVLDGQRSPVVDAAATGRCVGADRAGIHRRPARQIVDAAAVDVAVLPAPVPPMVLPFWMFSVAWL